MREGLTALLMVPVLAGCPLGSEGEGEGEGEGDLGAPFVTYTLGNGAGVSPSRVFRLALEGGTPVDVSAAVAGVQEGVDRRLVPSHNGRFAAMSSERFATDTDLVLLTLGADVTASAVRPGGVGVFIEGTPAINNAGTLIVFSRRSENEGEAARIDLYATRRDDDEVFGAAVLLSAASPRAFNNMPALSFDEDRVFFDCGDQAEPETPGSDNASCVVDVDGGNFAVVVAADALPGARADKTPQFPHEGVDGTLLLEGGWPAGGETPELIWRRLADGSLVPLTNFPNAVSPCGFADGRSLLLWLGRPSSAGVHELTLINTDDTTATTLLPDVDVEDIGIGCAG